MAATLVTYQNLIDAVLDWLNRTGDAAVAARVPTWIELCEATLRRTQEWFVQFYSLANAGAGLPFTAQPMELPSYIKDVEALWANTAVYKHAIEVLTPEAWRGYTRLNQDIQGVPRKAVIVPQMDSWLIDSTTDHPLTKTGSHLYLWPVPILDGTFQIDIKYLRDLTPLSASATNGLFVRHPDIYLYGTLVESAPFLQHDERLPIWQSRYEKALREINTERERAEYSASKKRVQLPYHIG